MSSMATRGSVLAAAYRAKAAEALELARQARLDGQQAAHSGYLSEALYWRAMADAVACKATQAGQEVTYP